MQPGGGRHGGEGFGGRLWVDEVGWGVDRGDIDGSEVRLRDGFRVCLLGCGWIRGTRGLRRVCRRH